MSYAAASSASNGNKRPAPAKARVAPSAKPQQNSSEPSVDESSYRLGGNSSNRFFVQFKMNGVTWSQQITLNAML